MKIIIEDNFQITEYFVGSSTSYANHVLAFLDYRDSRDLDRILIAVLKELRNTKINFCIDGVCEVVEANYELDIESLIDNFSCFNILKSKLSDEFLDRLDASIFVGKTLTFKLEIES